MAKELNSYDLSRAWWDFSFQNPEQVNPKHAAVYFFAIEHCNRLGWKEKFGFPSQMAMEAVGIKNWKSYSTTLNDLVKWGFIKMIQVSKNQYSSNIISLSATVKNDKAQPEALDKALSKHMQEQSTKQSQSTTEGTVSIDKQETKNKEQRTRNKEPIVYSSEVHEYFLKCLEYFPSHLHPDTKEKKNKWLDTLDRLERIDNLKLDLVRKIVKKTRADPFWSKNFLSLTKLRKTNKDDVTFIQVFYEQFKKGNKSSSNNIDPQDMQDYLREQQARTN